MSEKDKNDFDTVLICKYTVPIYLAIGKEYQRLILCVTNGQMNLLIKEIYQ